MNTSSPGSEDNQLMTSSYHEIVDTHRFEEGGGGVSDEKSLSSVVSDLELNIPKAKQRANKFFSKARNWVGELSTDGVVTQEEGQVTYVVEDLTDKIRLVSSPTTSPSRDIGEEEAEKDEKKSQR